MAADNLAGAPTQGLGQTVTFAFDPGRAVQQQNINTIGGGASISRQGQSGTFGVGANKTVDAPDLTAETLDVLGRLAGNIMKPAVERAKLENFSKGVQAAASGKAIQEIAAEQPWYATLFGEADAVQGARTYHAANKVYEAQGEIENQWDVLKTMSMDAGRAEINKIIASKMTGDPYADAEIQQQTTRILPGVFKSLAKEQVKHINEEAVRAEGQFQINALNAFQWEAERGDTGDRLGAFATLRQNFEPANGRRDSSWAENVTTALVTAANKGQLLAADAMNDVVPALPPEMQNRVLAARRAASNKKQAEVWAKDPELARTVAGLRGNIGNPTIAAKDMVDQMNAANVAYTNKYGGEPIFSAADIEAAASGQVRAKWQADQAAAKKAEGTSPSEKKVDELAEYDAYVHQPDVYNRVATGELEKGKVDSALYRVWAGSSMDYRTKVSTIIKAGRGISPNVQRSVQETVEKALTFEPGSMPVFSGAAQTEYAKWQEWAKQDPVNARNYYGAELNSKFELMQANRERSGLPIEQAFQQAMLARPRLAKDDTGAKAGVEFLRKKFATKLGFDSAEFTPESEIVAGRVASAGVALNTGKPPEEAGPFEIQARLDSGHLTRSGKYIWDSNPDSRFVDSIRNLSLMSGDPGDIDAVFDLAVEKLRESVGSEERAVVFGLVPKNAAGEDQVLVMVTPKDGHMPQPRYITARDVVNLASADRKKRIAEEAKATADLKSGKTPSVDRTLQKMETSGVKTINYPKPQW